MKETPILMCAEMVRATLEDRKTQTRRVGKCQHDEATELGVESIGHATKGTVLQATYRAFPKGGTARWALCECPYGQPGDRLWVRETFAPCVGGARGPLNPTLYRADNCEGYENLTWKPSIFMFRWESRLTLEITGVRVERVQEISDEDAIAEGIEGDGVMFRDYSPEGTGLFTQTPRSSYCGLWDSINAKRGFGWDKNPWVWVLTFKRITP